MALYRVLMVDDEEDIRVGIIRKMDWEGLGFCLVGQAENGREALELAEQLHPDLILTDIKMPFMDGLTLCKKLIPLLPAAKFVVFSGFDQFDYAKQAISIHVSEYVLKPINAAELSAVLTKLKQQLDAERDQQRNMELLRSRYENSLPILRELFYTRLLEGRIRPNQVFPSASQLGIDLSAQTWVVALAHLEESEQSSELLSFSVQELFEQQFSLPNCQCKSFFYSDTIALLFGFSGESDLFGLSGELNRLCTLSKSYLSLTLTVGIGTPCTQLESLPASTRGARNALSYRVMVGSGRSIFIGDLEPDSSQGIAFDDQDQQDLSNAVKMGSQEEIRTVVGRLVAKIQRAGLALSQSHLFFLELLTCLLRLTREGNLTVQDVFGTQFTGTLQLTDFHSLDALEHWCFECCVQISILLGQQRSDSAWRTVERAKQFIATHFAQDDLSVETLCDHLHLSPAYFSTLFKRETGLGFSAYVTEVRMEQAARLLRETEDKTYLIAQKIGYSDPNYFSYVFKRHFGATPSKYRTASS